MRAPTEGLQRTRVLPASVEILLAAGDAEEARHACGELEQAAERLDADILRAMSAKASGAVELAAGDAQGVALPAIPDAALRGITVPTTGRGRIGAARSADGIG